MLPFICQHRVLKEILPGSPVSKARQDSLWQPLLRPLLLLTAVRMPAVPGLASQWSRVVCSVLGIQTCCEASELLEKTVLQSVSTHTWRRALARQCDSYAQEELCLPPAGELWLARSRWCYQGGHDSPGAVTG